MKTFNIFQHPDFGLEPVKVGFSWPACFFGFLWMISCKLWRLAGIWFGIWVVTLLADSKIDSMEGGIRDFASLALALSSLGLCALAGYRGNYWKESRLREKGYLLVHTSRQSDGGLPDENPETLAGATRSGNLSRLNQMLREGADPNQITDQGRTALDVADSMGDIQTVMTLLNHGAVGTPKAGS